MPRLKDKVAFITGAAQGQGQSHAIMMAEEGADIIAVDIGQGRPAASGVPSVLEKTVAEVQKRGRRIVARHGDVAKLAELQRAVDEGVRELGRLDYVVANAAVTVKAGTTLQFRYLAEGGVWFDDETISAHDDHGAAITV